jgi:hypothetical protein
MATEGPLTAFDATTGQLVTGFGNPKPRAALRILPHPSASHSGLPGAARRGGCQEKPWLKTFGRLRGLRKETARINRILEDEFGQVEPEDWQ